MIDAAAKDAVHRVVQRSGPSPTLTERADDDITTANACIKGNERIIAWDARCTALVHGVGGLRESLLTPRPWILTDTVRACDRLSDAIEGIIAGIG